MNYSIKKRRKIRSPPRFHAAFADVYGAGKNKKQVEEMAGITGNIALISKPRRAN